MKIVGSPVLGVRNRDEAIVAEVGDFGEGGDEARKKILGWS